VIRNLARQARQILEVTGSTELFTIEPDDGHAS
jgi:hypothetical protein